MKIKYNLFPSQLKVLKSNKPVIALCAPRALGKSYINSFWCLNKLLKEPDKPGMLIAPTYGQSNELLSNLAQHCEKIGLQYTVNKAPTWCKSTYADHKGIFSVKIKKGIHSWIRVGSADRPDNLRGFSVSFLSLDEAAMLKEDTIDIVLPCLRGFGINYNYQTLVTTTPRGLSTSWFYSRFIEDNPNHVDIIRGNALENFMVWTEEKIKDIKSQMSDLMFRQEILGEFVDRNMNSMAYAFHDELVQNKPKVGKICLSLDQNVNPLTCGIFYSSDILFHSNEIVLEEANLEKMISEIHKCINNPQAIYMYGDRSGHNRTWTGAESFYNQLTSGLKKLGYRIIDMTNKKNPSVFDSNEVLNRLFEQNKYFISPECKKSIEHIKKASWKDGKYEMNKSAFDAHIYDLIRYICWGLNNKSVIKPIQVPKLF